MRKPTRISCLEFQCLQFCVIIGLCKNTNVTLGGKTNVEFNSKNTYNVVSTAGSYKFYHTGLTYNGGTAYTNNSGSIKNVVMEADDWDW